MRLVMPCVVVSAVLALVACGSMGPTVAETAPAGSNAQTSRPATAERIGSDTPRTTVAGNTFVAPAGWSIAVRGNATVLEAPEGGSFIVLVDIEAKDADSAIADAWSAYKPGATWPLA